MKEYKLSDKSYITLKKISFLNEIEKDIVLDDKKRTVSSNDISLLLDIIDDEIAVYGVTDDQERLIEYGYDLYALFDELYYSD